MSTRQQLQPGIVSPPALPTFPSWAISALERFRKAAGIGALLASAVAIKSLRPEEWISRWIASTPEKNLLQELLTETTTQRGYLALVQAGACLLLALSTPSARLLDRPGRDAQRVAIAHRSCRRIQQCVVLVFFLWALYYCVTGVRLLFAVAPDSAARPFITMLSGLTSLVLFWMYIEMGQLTLDRETVPAASRPADVTPLQLMGVGLAIVIIGLAWFGYAVGKSKVCDVADSAVACLSGVGLCLVVGRLGSKYLDPGPIALSLLYLYAVIQLGGAVFEASPAVHFGVTTIALPLKLLLWLVCVWAFTTGILGEYVFEVRALIEKVTVDRE